MFVLVTLKDTVSVEPRLFGEPFQDTAKHILNKKFTNKIVHQCGLCIAVWDIIKVEDKFIFPGNASYHCRVHFRMVVFRPFLNEVLEGKIQSSNSDGLSVTMGFFTDIFVPKEGLPSGSVFNEAAQQWAWQVKDDQGSTVSFQIFNGDRIKFRVVEEVFVDLTPHGPTGHSLKPDQEVPVQGYMADRTKGSPYTIIGSIEEAGLGKADWWQD